MSLLEKAKNTVLANHIDNHFVAGAHQFKTIWVRDFCYSVPGLVKMGLREKVWDELRIILSFMNESGQLPRGMDVVNPKLRVLWASLFGWLNLSPPFGQYRGQAVFPEYLGEHRTVAFDSNLLFLKASFESGFIENLTHQQIHKLLAVYIFNPWIEQPGFSDWQDSVRRNGPLLLTHLLYMEVVLMLQKAGFAQDMTRLETLAHQVIKNFEIQGKAGDKVTLQGLFRETLDSDQISLDSHVLLLTGSEELRHLLNLDRESIYERLKASALWRMAPIPGVPVSPEHPIQNVAWTVKLVGLRHYHDGFVWGWLSAEAFKIAQRMNDPKEAQRIQEVFTKANEGFDFLSEIYCFAGPGETHFADSLRPYKGLRYESERPFTWTSAKWVEALSP